MNATKIQDSFRSKICREIDVKQEGLDRYVIYTPFCFDDGDHFVVVLRREDHGWTLTDEGHTFMHMSYEDVDLTAATRSRVIEETLDCFGLANAQGELRLSVKRGEFGDALFSFVQALSRVTGVALWTRERVKSTFWEDFRSVMEENIPEQRMHFKYHDPVSDPDELYVVDCLIENEGRPWYVFALGSDSQCREATITLYHFERMGQRFHSLGIFQDQTAIGRKPLAMLSEVIGRQFPSLGNRQRISKYLKEDVLGEAA